MSADSPAAILYDGYGNPVLVINGSLTTVLQSNTGTITSVPVSTYDTVILASNLYRKGVFIYNDTSSAVLYLGLSNTEAATNNFSVLIAAGGLFEIPFGYTGDIHGTWSVNELDGYVRITELV